METASTARKRSARHDARSLCGERVALFFAVILWIVMHAAIAPDPAHRQKLLVENPARLFKFT
jgi:hypothetical protein